MASNFDKPIKYKKGHVIFAEGEASSFLYVVVKGEIIVFKEDKSRLIPISVVGEQDFIGELSMFSDEPRSATAIASVDTEVLMIKKTDIRKVMKLCPEWVTNIMITISDRLRHGINILQEHRISDDNSSAQDISPAETKEYMNSIKEYKSRRGL